MDKIGGIIKKLSNSPGNIRFDELCSVCQKYFGKHRQKNGSHRVYRTPWQGDPRMNIPKDKNGKAYKYQVKQVIQALRKLETEK